MLLSINAPVDYRLCRHFRRFDKLGNGRCMARRCVVKLNGASSACLCVCGEASEYIIDRRNIAYQSPRDKEMQASASLHHSELLSASTIILETTSDRRWAASRRGGGGRVRDFNGFDRQSSKRVSAALFASSSNR